MKKADWFVSLSYLALLIQMLPAKAEVGAIVSSEQQIMPAEENSSTPVAASAVESTAEASDKAEDGMAQVSSVSELSDVQPNDWAFQALQSLVERYGVIEGYPNGTFRGNRAMSRYEFVAALNAVTSQIETILQSGGGEQTREDLLTLQRLQSLYGSALEDLHTRLDRINSRTTELETQTFSTTTKLQGQVVIAGTGGTGANDTIVSRVRLNLLTSFTPGDQLVTQLEVGNNGLDAINFAQSKGENLFGTTGLLVDGGGLEYAAVSSQLHLYRLYYTFRPLANLAVTVGPKIVPSDFVDRNGFANNSSTNFGSSFFISNPLIVQNQIDRIGGAGAVVDWNVGGGALSLRALYVAADAENPGPLDTGGGLFGDRQQGTVEAEYAFSKKLIARLQLTIAGINLSDIYAGGINIEWAIDRKLGIFGRFGIANYSEYNLVLRREIDADPHTWAIGVVTRDLIIPGSLAGVAIGQPFVTGEVGNATQTNFETFYNLPLSDNISVTPSLMLVTNPNNDDSKHDIWQGTIRTVFAF